MEAEQEGRHWVSLNPGSGVNLGTEVSGIFIVAALRIKAGALYRQMRVNALSLRDIPRLAHCFSSSKFQDKVHTAAVATAAICLDSVIEFRGSTFAKRAATATT